MKGLLFILILVLGLLEAPGANAQSKTSRSNRDTTSGKNVPGEKELLAILRESPWYVYPSLDSGIVEFNKSPRPNSDMLTFEKGGKVAIICKECEDVVGTYHLKKDILVISLYYSKNLVSMESSYQITSADKDRIMLKNGSAQTLK